MALTWKDWQTDTALLKQLDVFCELKRAVQNRAQLIGVTAQSDIPAERTPADGWFTDAAHDPLTEGATYWHRTVIARWLKDIRTTLATLVAAPESEGQNHFTDSDWSNYSGVGSAAAGGILYSAAALDWPDEWYGAVNHFRAIVEALEWFEVYHENAGVKGAIPDFSHAYNTVEPFTHYDTRPSSAMATASAAYVFGGTYAHGVVFIEHEIPPYWEYFWTYDGARIEPGGFNVYDPSARIYKLNKTSIGTSIVIESKLWWPSATTVGILASYDKYLQDAYGGFPGVITPTIYKVTQSDYNSITYDFTGDTIYSLDIQDGDFSPVYNRYGVLTGYSMSASLSHINITSLTPAISNLYIGYRIEEATTADLFNDFVVDPPPYSKDGSALTARFTGGGFSVTVRTRAQGPLPEAF